MNRPVEQDLQVLILVGGKGTRLQQVISGVPKPMAAIGDEPFLSLLVRSLKAQGFTRICFLTGYKSETIEDYFGDGAALGIHVTYSHESTPLGTGGAIRQAIQSSQQQKFLVLNGDTYFDIDLVYFLRSQTQPFTIALRLAEDARRFGAVLIRRDYTVRAFVEKSESCPIDQDGCYINGGIYLLERKIINFIGDGFSSLESDVFPQLVAGSLLEGIPMGGRFLDIGVPEDYHRAQELLPLWGNLEKRPCLFLDRDGIVIEDCGYPHRPADLKIIPAVIPLIKWANTNNWLVIILTNQAGIAKGIFGLEKYQIFHAELCAQLTKTGVHIDATFYCPFHAEGSVALYAKPSLSRKPNPGMLLKAMAQFPIDIRRSLMIGDKPSDQLDIPNFKTLIMTNEISNRYCKPGKTYTEVLEFIQSWVKNGFD